MHPIAIIVNLRGLRNEDLQPTDNESDIFLEKHVGATRSYMGAQLGNGVIWFSCSGEKLLFASNFLCHNVIMVVIDNVQGLDRERNQSNIEYY